jgi:uncharacterized membrane protein
MTTRGSDEPPEGRTSETEARLVALEGELAAMRAELTELRGHLRGAALRGGAAPRSESPATEPVAGSTERAQRSLIDALRNPPPPSARSTFTGEELESWIGRYGTLAAGALVILLAVGTVIVWAVKSGLLTPAVRIAFGAVAAVCIAVAGLYFRRKGEQRYGNVLLALALATVDVVAWGAGPRLHLVPTSVALLVVDVASIALAALALHDESEFLFAVAIAGALSAPFVTADRSGEAVTLLAYGAAVLIGSLRAAREPSWTRAMILLAVGAALYVLAAAALPMGTRWHGPFLIPLFGATLALAALLLAQHEWRGILARVYLAAAMLGVAVGWDLAASRPLGVTGGVALGIAAVTYATLWVSDPDQPLWMPSALVLPLLSLGVASAAAGAPHRQGFIFALWGAFALTAWRLEHGRGNLTRAGTHLLAGAVLVALGIANELWYQPLWLVSALSGWGIVVAFLARDEESPLPLLAVAIVLGGAVLSALDQLVSLRPYAYTPFLSRPSASALCATIGLAAGGELIARGKGVAKSIADRGLRLGAVIGFAFLWGRMEFVHAYSLDLGTFLLTLYYAAVGVGSIVAGRKLGLKALRIAGLGLAIYAAAKAVVEATAISGISLRVGCYAAVGVFLLGAGYLYREIRPEAEPSSA